MSLPERPRTSRETTPAWPGPPQPGSSTAPADTCNMLACPFVKRHGPSGTKGHACTGKGFPSTHRVKQHVYRSHPPAITCPRCHVEFKRQTDLNAHLIGESMCDMKAVPDDDRAVVLTMAQMQELKKKRRGGGAVNEEEQWKSIYKIIFPDEAVIPSPYVHNVEVEFKRHFRAELAAVLRNLLVDKVPKDAKYTNVHSSLKSFLESTVDSGLVDAALDRASHSLKRRRTSSGYEDLGSIGLGQVATVPKGYATQDGTEEFEFTGCVPAVSNPSPGQHSNASVFSTDFRGNPWSAIHTPSPLISIPDASFSEAATWSFEFAPVSQPIRTVTSDSTEQTADDWLVSLPDVAPSFPPAVQQDQGTNRSDANDLTANTIFQS